MDKSRLAIVYALIAVGMWSTVATAFKLSLEIMSLTQLLAGATSFSLLTLSLYLLCNRQLIQGLRTLKQNIRFTIVFALLNPTLYYLILFKAYDLLPAQIAQSLNYTWAITLTLLSVPLLKHRLNSGDGCAIALGYAGVLIISLGGHSINSDISYLGIALALLSTLVWAIYWLLNARDYRDPIIKLFHSFIVACPLLWIISFTVDGFLSITLPVIGGMAYVGVFEMGLAFIFWQLAVHNTNNMSQISTLIFLSPFLSLFIINWMLNESISPFTYGGLALIVIGLIIQQRFKSKQIEAT